MRPYRRWRRDGWFRGTLLVPTLLAFAFITVFSYGFLLTGHYETNASLSQRLWATLAMFAGTYMPLSPDLGVPPPDMSVVGVLALSLTLVTASSLLLLSRRARDFVRTIHPNARLAVIGDGSTAAALIKSSIESRIPTILVTDSRASEAARAVTSFIPVIADGQLPRTLSTSSARRVLARVDHVVVATDSDPLNMQLHQQIRYLRRTRSDSDDAITRTPRGRMEDRYGIQATTAKDLVVINDPDYAQLLRPDFLYERLPSGEATCPAENVAEHICHLVVAAMTSARAMTRDAIVQIVHTEPISTQPQSLSDLSSAIETSLQRLAWSLGFVHGRQNGKSLNEFEALPKLTVVASSSRQPLPKEGLTIEIFLGSHFSTLARQVLADRGRVDLQIAIGNQHLLQGAADVEHRGSQHRPEVRTGRAWLDDDPPAIGSYDSNPLTLVVDPEEVGLDARLVIDDTSTQWARTFDLNHALMFSGGRSAHVVTGWQTGAAMGESTKQLEERRSSEATPGAVGSHSENRRDLANDAVRQARREIANRYSSKRAADRMLRMLSDRGYALQRWEGEEPPNPPQFSAEDVEYIAESEHEDWLVRTWTDTSRWRKKVESVSGYSDSGANKYCYRGLRRLESAANQPDAIRFAANYNRRIASETYPAIAASFGYAIVRYSHPRSTKHVPQCGRLDCPCKQDSQDRVARER
jgi:hypothetical protein